MRVLFVHSIGRKKYGGGERWAVNAAEGLHRKGNTVYAAVQDKSVMKEELMSRGVQTISFNLYSNLSLYQALRLFWIIRKYKIDVVICKGQELVVCGLAVKLSKQTILIRRTGSPPLRKKSRKLIWRTHCFVDGVVTNTTTIKQVYARHGFSSSDFVKVIYNGLSINDVIPPYDFSKAYPGKKVVLCVGRAVAHKGYFYLIDALPEIKKQFPDLYFYVVGDGKDKERLIAYAKEKRVEDAIYFAGYVHNPVPYFKGCDFFLHPSLYEGMPNAPMEAMAYGKPVIMTRVNGAEELSKGGEYALLIPPASPEAISGAIRNAMENPEVFKALGKKAKPYVRQTFGMDTMISHLENFITQRLAVKRKKRLNLNSE